MRGAAIIVVGGFVLSLVLAGCLGPADDPAGAMNATAPMGETDGNHGEIHGLVIDDAMNPVVAAQVAILAPQDQARSTLTDETGLFVFSHLPPGRYTLATQKLGFESGARSVNVEAGQTVDVQFIIESIALGGDPYHILLIGEGYFACGAYLIVVTWGNLHACIWDQHKPRYNFEAVKEGFYGVMQELVWQRNTALTAERLSLSLTYKTVCDPFCSNQRTFQSSTGPSPIRMYTGVFEDDAERFDEDPIPLSSVTFPASSGTGPVIVFQQRMTHYITVFYWHHSALDEYSGIPDQ